MLTLGSEVHTRLKILQHFVPRFPRFELQQESLFAHDSDHELFFHSARHYTEVPSSKRRVAEPHLRERASISSAFWVVRQDVLHLLRFFHRRHMLAHQEQIAEDDDMAPPMNDFLSSRCRGEADSAIDSSTLFALKSESRWSDLQAALLRAGSGRLASFDLLVAIEYLPSVAW